ncbi:hypothetical protein L7F22_059868 [Adiantum nelumboides]|nr:hypothetical protein [Adiantum nelumboides]
MGQYSHAEAPSKILLQQATCDYKEFSHRHGKSGSGSVYAGVLDDGATKIAVKKLEGVTQGDRQNQNRSGNDGQNYNLPKLMGYCERAEPRLLVCKFMEEGSLDQWLFASSSARVTTLLEDKADEQAATRFMWGIRYVIAVSVVKELA